MSTATRSSWRELVQGSRRAAPPNPLIGVILGEGIGPEVTEAALASLAALERSGGPSIELRFGGPVGLEAEATCGTVLPAAVVRFCQEVFAAGGAILSGPGGGRYVYELRRRFDLFCKLVPVRAFPELADSGRLRPESVRNVDVLLVRENCAGVYQGRWSETTDAAGVRRAEHVFSYTEPEARRILEAAARLAAHRRGEMTIVVKDAGVPSISRLWRDCAAEVAAHLGVRQHVMDVDHAAYHLLQQAQRLDVVVAPNLFGDILGDLGSVLLGSRGLSFSGNFSPGAATVFQTGHGAAYDIAGTDRANPAAQVLALAMLLREGLGLSAEARRLEAALTAVWRAGWRTDDLRPVGRRPLGTREMGERIAEAVSNGAAEAVA